MKNAINACDNFADVSLAYFNAVDGKDANYRVPENVAAAGVHFDEDKEFSISTFSVRGLDLTEAYVPQVGTLGIMSKAESGIKFNADGTFEMSYVISSGLIGTLKQLQQWGFFDLPFNVSDIIDLDINYLQSNYLQHMFPGFDYANLGASLDLISETTGFSVEGPDFNTQEMREMANELAETGNLVLRSFDVLGDSLGVTWKSTYRLVEVESALTGEKMTAIYIGEDFYAGETYLRFTYRDTEEGETLRMTVDVADLVLEGALR